MKTKLKDNVAKVNVSMQRCISDKLKGKHCFLEAKVMGISTVVFIIPIFEYMPEIKGESK